MRSGSEHKPHFFKRGLGFLFEIVLATTLLLVPVKYANCSVIKMPKPLPDVVRNYKSVTIYAGRPGMNHIGVKVKQGDYITILAKGSINVWPAGGKEYLKGPKVLLLFLLGENDSLRQYKGPELIEIKENGVIHLGYRGSPMSSHGKPLNPERFNDDIGSFSVDIIVWKTNDPKLMAKFLEEASLAQPKDEDLKEMAQEFKKRQEVSLALQKKMKEVEEIKKELSAKEGKKGPEIKKETKAEILGSTSPVIKKLPTSPDIVKHYKSVTVEAGIPGMHPIGVQVNRGDYITILAKGTIDLRPDHGKTFVYGPNGLLLFLLRENDRLGEYIEPELIEIKENGSIYLGYRGSKMSPYGWPLNPENFRRHTGSLSVDILVWRTKDPNLIIKYFDQACLMQPDDKDLKQITQEFKKRQKKMAAAKGMEAIQEKKGAKQELPDSTSPIIKMPSPLPNIIRSYKSVIVQAGRPGMQNTGLWVNQGEFVTILAEGAINTWPEMGKEFLRGPKAGLLFRFGNKEFARWYGGPEVIETPEDGAIFLGYMSSLMYFSGNPVRPENYRSNIGAYNVDIIVWKTKDSNLIAKFFDEATLLSPGDETRKEIVQEFKESQQKTKEAEAKLSSAPPAGKEIPELKIAEKEKQGPEQKVVKKEEKKSPVTSRDKEIDVSKVTPAEKQASTVVQKPPEAKKIVPLRETTGGKDDKKSEKVEDLTERLQKALQAVKELEEMKKKLSEREEREAQILARLESIEEQKTRQPKNLPVIAVAYPKDGITIDSEYVTLFGVAEHEKGILKFEILLNDKPIASKDRRDVKLVPKGEKRIDFSEKIRLREGQNKIAILVQSEDGLTNQKILSVHLAKKRDQVYAVVIGINRYKNFPSLKYAANDAQEFYRYLVEENQVPKDHIWLLLDEEATLDKLRTTLGTLLRRNAGKDDTVIIFLAGHGAAEQDVSSPDGDGLEKYILPHNADPKDLYATAMPMSEVARIFQRISSERLVFIGDTCYSGASGGRTIPYPGMRANISGAFLDRISQGKGRVIMTASDANELSVERDDMKHGVFTYYLLEGLRGKADLDKDGVITVDEVYRYVSTMVPRATGQGQHPARKGEVTGQIVLGVVR